MLTKEIAVTGRVSLNLPAGAALAVLWDLANLEQYEPKVDAVRVTPAGDKRGTYVSTGRFAGIPWEGRFSYELNGNGFRSEMIQGPPGMKVKGGFAVKAQGPDRAMIIHYEYYQFPRWLAPLALPLRLYLCRAMKKELRNVADLIGRNSSLGVSTPLDPVVTCRI